MENRFSCFARKVAKNPWKVILVAFSLSCLCGFGLIRLKDEYRIEKLYVPSNSEAEIALREGANYFVNSMNSRQEEIIFLPKAGKTIFSETSMKQIARVAENVVNIPNYRKLCKPKASFLKNYKQYNSSETCMVINPLELLKDSEKHGGVAASFKKAILDKETLMSNGRPAGLNVEYMFSDFNNLNFENKSTHSIRVIFFMQQAESGPLFQRVTVWEENFIKTLQDLSKDFEDFVVSFAAERSMSDSVLEGIRSDIPFMSVTFAIMIFIAGQIHGNKTNPIRGHNLLLILGVYSSALGVLAGFGLVIACGVPFISIVGILPFLVVSIGIDDIFIIIDEFDKMPEAMPANRKVSHTIAKVGATITMTTLTDIIVFAVGTFSSFPAIRYFCIFGVVTFSAEFLIQMTLFVALLSLDARRMKAGRRDCLPFCKGEDKNVCWEWKGNFTPSKIMTKYGQILLKWPPKLFVLLLTAGMLFAGIYGIRNLNEEFSRKLLAKRGTSYRSYLNAVEANFTTEIEVNLLRLGSVNYASVNEQNKIIEAPKLAYSSGFCIRRNISWMASFKAWANGNNIVITERNFSQNLNAFLNIPRYSFFNGDVIRDSRGKILATRIYVYLRGSVKSSFHKTAMLGLRKVLAHHEIHLTPMSNLFLYFEQYVYITSEVIRNVLCAAGIVAIVTAFFCIHPLVTISVVVGLVILVVELFGLMHFWNVSLHSISMLNLVLAVGFSVDYSSHFAHAFSVSSKDTVEGRIIDALSGVGWSILMGGLSTFIGILTLAFSSSDIFVIFFKMLFGIVVLGLFNGLVLLPVVISLQWYFFKGMNVFWLPVWMAKKYGSSEDKSKDCRTLKKTANNDDQKSISIVGISARFPKARNKDEFWELLMEGRRTLGEYPSDREDRICHFKRKFNPNRPMTGRMYVTKGSYMDDIDMFDHHFFGISHTEARSMDPQQRLILQSVFEAIEDAGLRLEDLQNCRTGVYVGLMNWDYEGILRYNNTLVDANQFSGTGSDPCVAANRISFALNFTGPSLYVNTACSSSLSALNIAYDHLKSRRCDVAIVSAANILLDPIKHVTICQANMLAADGQCKTFDASADGYGRGEGIATVILKPSFAAEIDGDHIYCNILSCGINSDGRGAIPITAPSAKGQQNLFQEVLASSGIRADDIHYVEAHGTGTIIGDAVETESIANVYSSVRTDDNPLRIGSVKSNINHTESTSGLAGLVKVCLMIENKKFVPTVGIEKLNPTLQTEERKIKVQQEVEDWTIEAHKPRIAAVNSFGYGGSNGHVILQEEGKKSEKKKCDVTLVEKPYVVLLSAHSLAALKETCQKFAHWLGGMNDESEIALDVCYSLYQRRTHHDYRIAVGFDSMHEAADLLRRYSDDNITDGNLLRFAEAKTFPSPSKIGFIFGGQGSSRPGIVNGLRKNKSLGKYLGRVQSEISTCEPDLSIFDEESSRNETNHRERQVLTSLKIFAVEYSVAHFLIEKAGIYPLAVAGHSLGDISAACVSGYISLIEAIKMIIIRSNLQEQCTVEGSMMAVAMSPEEIENLIDELNLNGKVVVAGKNDDHNVTLSGDSDAVAKVEGYLKSERPELFCRMLKVNKAFHSHHLDPFREDFYEQVNKIKLAHSSKKKPVRSTLYSTVKGKRVSYNSMSTDYFWENMRNPVLFNEAIQNMLLDGCRVLIEISPVPILSRYLSNIVKHASLGTDEDPVYIMQSLPRLQESDIFSHIYIQCIGRLYTVGYQVCWDQLFDYSKCSFIQYPLYSWQETKHWCFEVPSGCDYATCLLGKVKKDTTSNGKLWANNIDCFIFRYLSGHQVRDLGPVFPGAGYLEMAMEAKIGGPYLEPIIVEDLRFESILTLPNSTLRRVYSSLVLDENKSRGNLEIYHLGSKGNRIVLASAAVEKLNCSTQKARKPLRVSDNPTFERWHIDDSVPEALQDIRNELLECIEKEVFLEMTRRCGFEYSGDFILIDKIWRSSNKVLCRLKLTESVKESLDNYVLHPAITDVCFQSCIALLPTDDKHFQKEAQFFPVGVRQVTLIPPKGSIKELYCITSAISENSYDTKLLTDSGEVLVLMEEYKTSYVGDKSRPNPDPETYMIGFDQHQDNNRYDDMKEDVNFLFLMSQSTTKLAEGFLKAVPGITTKPTNVINRTLTTSAKEMEEIRDEIIMINKTNPGPLIVVNLLPGVAREDKAEVDYIVQCQKDTVFFCLEILKLLSKLNIHKTTLGVVIEKSMLMANDKAETLNFPIATAIIGLARTAALEQSSVNVLYADIDLELTQSQYSTVLQFFCKRNSGTELLVRKNGCFLPKLERVQLTHDSNEEMVVSAAALLPSKHQPKYLSYSPSRERFALKLDATLLPPGKNDVEMNVSYVSSFSSDITPLLENLKKKKGTSFLKFAVGKVSSAGDAAKETFTHDTQIMACFDGIMVQTSMTFEADQVFVVPSTITAPQVSTLLPPLVNSYHILKKTVFNLPEDQNVLILLGNEEIDLSVFLIILAKALKLNVAFCGSFRIELMEKFNIKKWSYHEVLPFINNPKPLFDFVFCPTNVSDVIMLAVSKMLKPDGQFIILDCSNGNDPTSVPVPKTCSCMRLNALEVKYINPKNVHVEWEKCVEILETSGLFSLVLALPCSVIRISDTVQGAEYSQVGFQALKLNQTDEGSITLQRPSLDIFGMRRNVCYLVIGGAGGFGFETVKWLIRRGAKFVIVCGRSTATVATDEAFRQLEREKAVKILCIQVDVSAQEGIETLEKSLLNCPPLAGVITSAVVYDDRLFTDIDEQSLFKVFRPKVTGTILLHKMIERLQIELDFFILYSSISSLGNIGQTSYSAANTFLDNFAGYISRTVGKRCLSVNWGAIRIGELKRNKTTAKQLENAGHGLLDPQKALDKMEEVLVHSPSMHNVVIADIDWPTFLRGTSNETNPFYQDIFQEYQEQFNTRQSNSNSLAELIQAAENDEEKYEIVRGFVSRWLAAWSGGIEADVDLQVGLHQYGVDSAGAVGFQMQLQKQLGMPIEVLFLMQQDTNGFKLIQQILKFLAEESTESLSSDGQEKSTGSHQSSSHKINVSDNTSDFSSTESTDCSYSTDLSEQEKRDTRETLLVPIYNPKEAKCHFFCVHGAHRYYGHISPIAAGFTFQEHFGMYAFGFTDPAHVSEDWGSIRSLAMQYVKEMQVIQPEGPYFMGGYSAGGLIALEMASILLEIKEQVGLLVLIDTFPWIPDARTNTKKILESISTGIDKVKNMMFDDYLEDFLKKIAVTRLGMHRKRFEDMLSTDGRDGVIKRLLRLAEDRGIEIPNIDSLYLSITRNFHIAQKATKDWYPGKKLFRGPTLYMSAYDKRFATFSPGMMSNGEMWKAVLGGRFFILECPGDHHSMIREPTNAKNMGHAIIAAATLSLRKLRPYKVREQVTFIKRTKLMLLKQQGLTVGAFQWKEGLKSVYAKVGKLLLSDDETFLIFKEETDRYSMEKQKCFRVKGKYMSDLSGDCNLELNSRRGKAWNRKDKSSK